LGDQKVTLKKLVVGFLSNPTMIFRFREFFRRHFGGLQFTGLNSPGAKGAETKLREEEAISLWKGGGDILQC